MKLKRPTRIISRIAAILIALAVCVALAIALFGLHDRRAPADAIIVFGNTVNPDGTPSPRLRARLDVAVSEFRHATSSYVLVSGALGKEGFDESLVMKQYLLTQGVPEDHLLQDPNGVTTEATAQDAKKILAEHHLTSVLVTSQFFHIARAVVAFQTVGIPVQGHIHAPFFEWRDLYSLAREVIALPVYELRSLR